MLVPNFWEKLENKKKSILEGEVFKELPIRKGFGDGLLLLGKQNPKVVALCADLTESTQVMSFKEAYPDRFLEVGIAEQNMASVASGMAAMGKIPFIASYAMFSPGRNWEQIRTTICYNNVPVKIIGAHAGLSVGPDGGTHQALEDMAIMKVLPNIEVIVPADALEAKKATLAIAETNKPTYLRLAREKSPIITNEEDPFDIGRANIIYESENIGDKKIGIIACGEMVVRSMFVVKDLEKLGISVGVMNMHTIKPIDKDAIKYFADKYKNILTAEEHQVSAGLGSSVLEVLALLDLLNGTKLKMIGVEDEFGQSGQKEELFEVYKLNEKFIIKKIKEFF